MGEEDPEKYKVQFAKFVENDIEADQLEEMYKNCHAAIRENPKYEKAQYDEPIVNTRCGNLIKTNQGTEYTRMMKRSKEQRHDTVAQKKAAAAKRLMAEGDDEEEDYIMA